MVWIHGGGLTGSDASTYDPTPLVSQGVIVVTFNYRLGLLGFFAQTSLDAHTRLKANYGFMDQQFALKWVGMFRMLTDETRGATLAQCANGSIWRSAGLNYTPKLWIYFPPIRTPFTRHSMITSGENCQSRPLLFGGYLVILQCG